VYNDMMTSECNIFIRQAQISFLIRTRHPRSLISWRFYSVVSFAAYSSSAERGYI